MVPSRQHQVEGEVGSGDCPGKSPTFNLGPWPFLEKLGFCDLALGKGVAAGLTLAFPHLKVMGVSHLCLPPWNAPHEVSVWENELGHEAVRVMPGTKNQMLHT